MIMHAIATICRGKRMGFKEKIGGEIVIEWACFNGKELSMQVILNGKQNGAKYVSSVLQNVLPFAADVPLK